MVSQVSAGTSAVQGVRHLHRIHRDAEWASRSAPEAGDSARPASDGAQIGGGSVQARRSLDSLRQALTSGDPSALRGAVHAFRIHDETTEARPVADAVSGAAAAPADGATPGWRVHRGYEAGGYDHGRRALMATLGTALRSADLEAARQAYADLTANRGQQAQAPAAAQVPGTTMPTSGELAPVEPATPAAAESPVPAAGGATPAAAQAEVVPAEPSTLASAPEPAPAAASGPAPGPASAPDPVPSPDITAIPPAAADAAPAATGPAAAPTATAPAGKPNRQDAMAALGTALAAGDIDAARKAFAELAAQGARGHHGHHHHHHHHHDAGESGAQPAASSAAATSPSGEVPSTAAPAPAAEAAAGAPAAAAIVPDATPADETAPA